MENGRLQTAGFKTTMDLARQQSYGPPVTTGVKRTQEQRSSYQNSPTRLSVTSAGIQNNVPFKRPTLDASSARINASEIYNVDPKRPKEEEAPPSEYSQRMAFRSTPGLTQNPLLSLAHPKYDLPESLLRNLARLGINKIYPWQSSCLLGRGLLEGQKNLVYSAPTGGGKSLVADVLLLKRVIEEPGAKAMLVLPFVALVQEKLKWLRNVVKGVTKKVPADDDDDDDDDDSGGGTYYGPARKKHVRTEIRVAGFFGGSKSRSTLADVDIAVCVIEKANAMINGAVEDCTIDQLRILVLDELHMIDDQHRGYLVELMATKVMSLAQGTQVIGMSATLSNMIDLARWLDSKFYESKYKPIPIEDYLVYDNCIYSAANPSAFLKSKGAEGATQAADRAARPCRRIEAGKHAALKSAVVNAVVALSVETIRAGYGALVFCGSRRGCEVTAGTISEAAPTPEELGQDVREARLEVLNELRSSSVGLEPTLEKAIVAGVAYHHAGLTTEEREIVANAFDRGTIKVIVATCSLAAGVNLPARRVILQGAVMGRDLVGPSMLRQMKGRAGRKGKDELGETYMCCHKRDLEQVAQLLEADLPAVQSSLTAEKRGFNRALLEVVATGLATSRPAIDDYVRHTLLFHMSDAAKLTASVESAVQWLVSNGLIEVELAGVYRGTQLGQAIVAASLTPEDGLFVHAEIRRALRAFVLDGDLHIFYMFTPIQASSGLGEINWDTFRDQLEELDESSMRVLELVGVSPGFVNNMAQGGVVRETTTEEVEVARVHRRFFAALQLRDLCNELPVHVVAKKYDMPRGHVQSLAQTCEGFGAGVIKFCERMGWGMLAAVLEHMSDRLKAGARADLLDLAKIAYVKSRTARAFWENGLKSVRAVAEAEPADLMPILLQAAPKRKRLQAEEEQRYRNKLVVRANIIIQSANRLWNQQMQVDLDE